MEILGNCHCGNLSFVLRLQRKLEECRMGECDCSFCVAHGAKCIADSRGRATIRIRNPAELNRYQVGFGTADFLVCRHCGVYLGAVIENGGAAFSVLNLRATDLHDIAASRHSYAAETRESRITRRTNSWTPTEIIIEHAPAV